MKKTSIILLSVLIVTICYSQMVMPKVTMERLLNPKSYGIKAKKNNYKEVIKRKRNEVIERKRKRVRRH